MSTPKIAFRSILGLSILILFSIGFNSLGQDIKADAGVLNALEWDFENDKLPLKGQWLFFDNQLISPQQIDTVESSFSKFPLLWKEGTATTKKIDYATYSLIVVVDKSMGDLAIDLPQIYCSYNLWINNKLIAKNGTPGKTKKETKPQWMPQTVSFKNNSDTLRLVLQVANFHHYNGGIKDDIFLGSQNTMQNWASNKLLSTILESGLLALLSLVFIIIYFLKDKKVITLYFSLLCLTWSVRALFSNNYAFISFFPSFKWILMIQIEYISLFLTMIWALLFISKLFPLESSRAFKYLMIVMNIIFIVLALFTKPIVFTQFITFYIVSCAFVLIYCVIIVMRAWVRQRIGVNFLLVSILLGIIVFTLDIFAYAGLFTFQSLVIGIGYLIAFYLMAPALLQHLKIIKHKSAFNTILTYEDLYKKQ